MSLTKKKADLDFKESRQEKACGEAGVKIITN